MEPEMSRASNVQTLSVTSARARFSQLLNDVFRRHQRFLIEKQGIPIAGIVSADDVRRLETLDREREERFEMLESISERFEDVDPATLEREIATALREVRAEYRLRSQGEATAPSE
jgi:prevent-host-death family protein